MDGERDTKSVQQRECEGCLTKPGGGTNERKREGKHIENTSDKQAKEGRTKTKSHAKVVKNIRNSTVTVKS